MYEGWTLSDLAGELWARGIDIDDVSTTEIAGVLHGPYPERAADKIMKGEKYGR